MIAGPGSGKTFVITHRIQYLIEHHGISPEKILVITFTKAAANEMKKRAQQLIQERLGAVTFGTFHAIFYDIIRKSNQYRHYQVIREKDKLTFLRDLILKKNLDIENISERLTEIMSEIGRYKSSGMQEEEFIPSCMEKEDFIAIFGEYQKNLKENQLLDFEDMILLCNQVLTKHPEIKEKWQERYSYILIDEFQDVNILQFETIRLIAEKEHNLFVVGDDDQSIYGFRGSMPEIMLGFFDFYPEGEKVELSENFRSVSEIVEAAGNLIKKNTKRFEKHLSSKKSDSGFVKIIEYESDTLELLSIVEQIRIRSTDWDDMAILVRTNAEASYVAEILSEYQIPFRIRERLPDIYSHFVGEDIITYCKMAIGDLSRINICRVGNRPKRYISRKSLVNDIMKMEDLRSAYREFPYMREILDKLERDLMLLAKLRPFMAIQYILKGIGYESYLAQYAMEHKIRLSSLLEVVSRIRERSKRFKSIEAWLQAVEIYQSNLEDTQAHLHDSKGVTIATMHASKGLEFSTVYIVNANEGSIPYRRAMLPDEIEEERRMFYVAMTRAKKELFILYANKLHEKQTAPSRFLQEIKSYDSESSSSNSSNSASSKNESKASVTFS